MTDPFTIDALIKEAKREVRMRNQVYRRWVEQGRMSGATANVQIAQMQAISDALQAVKDQGLCDDLDIPKAAQADLLEG